MPKMYNVGLTPDNVVAEDMQDGQILENRLKITNPFKAKRPEN
jgi:predicted nucleic acid-binding protein